MSFLTAEWRKLVFANYKIDSKILKKYVPSGTELDLWNEDCYVSFIGFMFENVKLLGFKIPYHINFEEVNLRFYVKRFENGNWKRGVVFIKEIVPKKAIVWIANGIYNENYEYMPMKHRWDIQQNNQEVSYYWGKNSGEFQISVEAGTTGVDIEKDSETEFITEHYWGYAKVSNLKTNEYEVTHPRWKAYEVKNHHIQADFGKLYGNRFQFLNNRNPDSVMLVEGSTITIENKKTIRK